MNQNKIDIVIPFHDKDKDIIEMCVEGCFNNIRNLGKIYLVTAQKQLQFDGIELINEDELFDDGLSKKYIESRCNKKMPKFSWRAGWVFQQFIKMGCSYAIPNLTDYYLVVDADVVFTKKIDFIKNGWMLLTETKEHCQDYYNCCEKLLGEQVNRQTSFVAHHMLISKILMLELLENIEKTFMRRWYDAILDNLDTKKGLMISEYQLYGQYLLKHYPEKIRVRKLTNIQRFKKRSLLAVLFHLADYVTLHNYKKPENNPKTNPWIYSYIIKLLKRRLRN